MVHYQVLLCLDTYDTDAIATNKQCKLKIRYFTIYLVISQQQSQGFFKVQIWCITKIKILLFIDLLPVIDLYNS